jgi:hypothetical protein
MFKFYRERKDDLQCRISKRKTLKDWWYDISSIFSVSFEIGLREVLFHISIFDSLNFKINFVFPHYSLNFIERISRFLSWDKSWSLTKHEALEIEMSPNYYLTLGVFIHHSIHTAHAGISIEIKLIFFDLLIRLGNDYHWNGEKNKRIERDYETGQWME